MGWILGIVCAWRTRDVIHIRHGLLRRHVPCEQYVGMTSVLNVHSKIRRKNTFLPEEKILNYAKTNVNPKCGQI